MKHVIVTVYDSAAQVYSKPFFELSVGTALRSFEDAAANKDSSISQHPEHYSMFILGTYDQSNGSFELHNSPVLIKNAWEIG